MHQHVQHGRFSAHSKQCILNKTPEGLLCPTKTPTLVEMELEQAALHVHQRLHDGTLL